MLIRGEVGAEEVAVNATRRGRLQITGASMSAVSQVAPALGIFNLPFLFDTVDQMDFVLETAAKAEVAKLLDARGLAFLNWVDSGWVGIYAKEKLVEPAQIEGYKLRTPTVVAAQVMAQVLNADAVFIPYPDIIPALQTGLIRGGITSDYAFFTGGINAEAPYFIYTRHTYDAGAIFANQAWFESQSPKNQAMLRTAYGDPVEFRTRLRAYTDGEMAKLPAKGTQVLELTPEQRARWVAATRPSHRIVLDQLGAEAAALYQALEEAKRDYNARKP